MKLLSLFKKKKKIQDKRLTINVLPGFDCNLRCKMCYIWRMPPYPKISSEEWVNLIKILGEYKNQYSTIDVDIGGGEPYLQSCIFQIFSECKKFGFRSNVTTNGFLLTKRIIDRSIESGLTGISFSLESIDANLHDSLRGVNGTNNKVMEAIKYVKKTDKLELSIVTILMKSNLNEIIPLARWVQNLESVAHSFQAVSEPPGKLQIEKWYNHEDNIELWPDDIEKMEEVIDKLIEIKKKEGKKTRPIIMNTQIQFELFKKYFRDPENFIKHKGCSLIDKDAITINPDGSVYICPFMKPVGNITKYKLKDILNSEKTNDTIKIMNTCTKNCHHLLNCYYKDEK